MPITPISFFPAARSHVLARGGGCGCDPSGEGEIDADSTEDTDHQEEEIPETHDDHYVETIDEEYEEITCVPTEEVCDGADNDCDSEIDEGVLNACGTCGPAPAEICNGLDDNCDGSIDETWDRTFSGTYDPSLVQQTTDGGYVIANSNALIKTDAAGNEVWRKVYFSEGNDRIISSVRQTLDGGYILAGSTRPNDEGTEGEDAWLLKADAEGNEEWTRVFDGVDANADWFTSVEQTIDGGYIAAGVTGGSYGTGNANFWLFKTDSSGNRVWDRTFDGGNLDYASSVQQTSDGGYILAGTTGFTFGGTSDADAWLIKTDNTGNEEWNRTFGGSSDDSIVSVRQTTDGGYILAGTTESYGAGREDLWLLKTDVLGNREWDRTFGGDATDNAVFAQPTTDGGYALFGTTNSFTTGVYSGDLWLIKTDASGARQWDTILGGDNSDFASSGQQTRDGGYVLAGHTLSFGSGIWLVHTCPPSE